MHRRRPLIGIPTASRDAGSSIGPTPSRVVYDFYVDPVISAGGVPILLVPVCDQAVDAVLDAIDGLFLIGGEDVDPPIYGGERDSRSKTPDRHRDDFEIELTRRALEVSVPVFAVCRGHQLLNVALGGSLITHVETDIEGAGDHDDLETFAGQRTSHSVSVVAGSDLFGIVGDLGVVNSLHHQAIDRLGKGLVVSARHPRSGVIEAVERPGGGFCIGVQWHPEMIADAGTAHFALFEAFVAAAETYSADIGRSPAGSLR